MIEPTQLELDERQNSYEAGYITGISDERERIIALLEADKCELEEKCTCGATIAHMVATIKGKN